MIDDADGNGHALARAVGDRAEGIGNAVMHHRCSLGRNTGVGGQLMLTEAGIGDQACRTRHDPSTYPAPGPAALKSIADVGEVREIDASHDDDRGLAKEPCQRHRDRRMPSGEPAVDHLRPNHGGRRTQQRLRRTAPRGFDHWPMAAEHFPVDCDERRVPTRHEHDVCSGRIQRRRLS